MWYYIKNSCFVDHPIYSEILHDYDEKGETTRLNDFKIRERHISLQHKINKKRYLISIVEINNCDVLVKCKRDKDYNLFNKIENHYLKDIKKVSEIDDNLEAWKVSQDLCKYKYLLNEKYDFKE